MKLDEAIAAGKSACQLLQLNCNIMARAARLADIKHYRILCMQRGQLVNVADTQ